MRSANRAVFLIGHMIGLLLASCAMPAFAQVADDKPADTGEIVVTAQKRSERLQDVPISVSAIGGDALLLISAES